MLWLRLVYIFLACFICSIGAGIGIARRIVKDPKLALATTVGISGIALYLAGGLIYISGVSWHWAYLVTAICLVEIFRNGKELRRWWDDASTRDILVGWVLLQLWVVLVNLNIRHFAIWIGDWQEHYDRALFFLQHWPVMTRLSGGYYFPARPAMMNMIETLLMAQSGATYDFYQMASGFLNASLYLAVAGMACDWGGRRMGKIVAALLALSPWFMQNETYPWTKLYCAFYVVLGIWLYHREFRTLGLLMLTAGSIVHYSALVVAAYVAIYDLCVNHRQWRRIAISWLVSAALLMTWVGWAWVIYGSHLLVGSTSTAMEAEKHSRAELVKNFAWNAYLSVIPRGFHPNALLKIAHSYIYPSVKIRDALFLAYEPGLLWAWGAGGMVAIIWALWHARLTGRAFWVGFVFFTYIGGLLVCTPQGYDMGGVAHVILQPVVWVGMAWLVSRLAEMPRWVVRVWLAGVFFDACWVMFHFILEGQVLQYVKYPQGYFPADSAAATLTTWANVLYQLEKHLRLLGMNTVEYDSIFLAAMICCALIWWISLRQGFLRNAER